VAKLFHPKDKARGWRLMRALILRRGLQEVVDEVAAVIPLELHRHHSSYWHTYYRFNDGDCLEGQVRVYPDHDLLWDYRDADGVSPEPWAVEFWIVGYDDCASWAMVDQLRQATPNAAWKDTWGADSGQKQAIENPSLWGLDPDAAPSS
jgi:hypothetical protein